MAKIEVLNREVQILTIKEDDYICLTDIARYKDAERTDYLISNWLRNRNTIEFLGIWEQINNPGFKPIEFDGFRKRCDFVKVFVPLCEADIKKGLVQSLPPKLPPKHSRS